MKSPATNPRAAVFISQRPKVQALLSTLNSNFVGEETVFTLPYSKILANVSDLYWQSSWPSDHRTWIAPQIYTPPSFEMYRQNRDPAMEAIMAYSENP
ncbi:MAG: hypothetical protein QOD00_767 [Blastocatellia bacterium]|jgi:hypothetical protein|nr:hypothetical protein [Blastocatellia bacterium]